MFVFLCSLSSTVCYLVMSMMSLLCVTPLPFWTTTRGETHTHTHTHTHTRATPIPGALAVALVICVHVDHNHCKANQSVSLYSEGSLTKQTTVFTLLNSLILSSYDYKLAVYLS